MDTSIKSKGEEIVRIDFNASFNSKVDEIKKLSADLINIVQNISCDSSFENQEEIVRLRDFAILHYETAAMFAVKLATSKKR